MTERIREIDGVRDVIVAGPNIRVVLSYEANTRSIRYIDDYMGRSGYASVSQGQLPAVDYPKDGVSERVLDEIET